MQRNLQPETCNYQPNEEPSMTFHRLNDIAERELAPGYRARLIHTEHMTLSYVRVDAGAPLPEHAHPHEQVTSVIEGQFELVIAGTAHRMGPGEAAVIPPNAPHSGKGLTACYILDVFYPVREDLRRAG
jgi:quercetin dioxygenase-like cupin family protein